MPLTPSSPAIPILLYHKVGPVPKGVRRRGQFVPPPLFRRHLQHLRRRAYRAVPLSQLRQHLGDEPAPHGAKLVAITFDDGYLNLHAHALPLLAEFGIPATVFLVAGHLGGESAWDAAEGDSPLPLLGLAQLREMAAAGIEFGSHGMTHAHLAGLAAPAACAEVTSSKQRLEDALGTPCRSFAYPYGEHTPELRRLVREAGYELACATQLGVVRPHPDWFALPRVNIRRYSLLPRFWAKLRAAHRPG